MENKKPPFRFLSHQEFAALSQDEKIAYLAIAMQNLGATFSGEQPAKTGAQQELEKPSKSGEGSS